MNNRTQGMPCPVDGAQLVMSERSGIEIDYCPTCRGVWLDRGELDKIIERATAEASPPAAQPQAAPSYPPEPVGYGHGYGKHGGGKHGRRRSFLHDLFD